jgi:hypothetical protein
MVLDAKALTWAAQHDIDTAKLKKARVPIFGKWYFPEIPPGVPLVNLETGEQQVFPERMVAGEVIYVPAAELLRAGLVGDSFAVMPVPGQAEDTGRALRTIAPEPLLAMARPPGYETGNTIVPVDATSTLVAEDPSALAGIHMPSPSIAPFVLGVGFCIAMLGAIANPVILVVGLLWMLAGAVAWIRVGLLEQRATALHSAHTSSETAADHVAEVEHPA